MAEPAIERRRDLARKAFEECPLDEHDCTSCSRDRCIEVATQVRITDEAIRAADEAYDEAPGTSDDQMRAALRAAALRWGFEVIE